MEVLQRKGMGMWAIYAEAQEIKKRPFQRPFQTEKTVGKRVIILIMLDC